jgi:ligand-binding sensor domain-containing protein/signal transduction histidine kinase
MIFIYKVSVSLHAKSASRLNAGSVLAIATGFLKCVLGALFFSAFILSSTAHASTARNPRFDRIAVDQGLSHNTVNAVIQDRQGFLWIATQGGLNRYDGYRFQTFRRNSADAHSIADDWVYALHIDHRNQLWVGSRGGLQRFNPRDGKFLSVLSEDTRAIESDGEGGIWAGTTNGLVHILAAGGEPVVHRPVPGETQSLSHLRVHALARTSAGDLWIGTEDGLNLLKKDKQRQANNPIFERFRLDSTMEISRDRNNIHALLPGVAGELWIGTEEGLEVLSADRQERKRISSNEYGPMGRVRSLLRDDTGSVWIAGLDQGLFRWDSKTERMTRYRHDPADTHSPGSDLVTTLLQDRSGVLWVGTWNAGLSRLNLWSRGFDRMVRRARPPYSLSDNNVNAVHADQVGRIWIGTLKGGLNQVDRNSGLVRTYRHQPGNAASISSDDVECFLPEKSGKLWTGTERGLDLFDPATGLFTRVKLGTDAAPNASMFVRALARDSAGKLWIAAAGALYRFDPATRERRRYAEQPNQPKSLRNGRGVNTLLFDRKGQLWIGTAGGGLNRLDGFERGEAQFSRFSFDPDDPLSLSDDVVTSLLEDQHGHLWAGTSNGLNRVVVSTSGKVSFRRYAVREGLQNPVVAGMAEDAQGNLWVSTDTGLSRLDVSRTRFRHFGAAEGMIDGGYTIGAASSSAAGPLYFGGYQGLSVVDPAQLQDNPVRPEVRITDFLLSNRSVRDLPNEASFAIDAPVELAENITLSHIHPMFAIEFAALHFADPSRTRYEYRLEGFDKEWRATDARHRLATYTNLSPGSYDFRVKAISKDEVSSANDLHLRITITPPFWKTWWFCGLMVMAGIMAAILMYRWRIHRLARQFEYENLAVRAKAELDSAAGQRRFVAMVSHELRNPLAIMETAVKNLRRVDLNGVPPSVAQRLEKIQRAQERVQSLVDNFLTEETLQMPDLTPNKQKVDLLELLNDVVTDIGNSTAKHHVYLSAPSTLPLVKIDREMMRIALSNLIENAIKYSPGADAVDVRATCTASIIEIVVKDYGIGIDENDLPCIFEKYFRANHGHTNIKGVGLGLYVVQRIVELHYGSIRVESKVGIGTSFIMRLTCGKPAFLSDSENKPNLLMGLTNS